MERQNEIRFDISFFWLALSEMKSETNVTRRNYSLVTSSNTGIREKKCFENLGKIVEKYHFNKVFSCRPATLLK